MKTIKGLAMKDYYQLKNYRKSLLVFMVVFILTAYIQPKQMNPSFMLPFMMSFAMGMYGLTSFHYDEQGNTLRYILTLPISRKEIVLSKYVFLFGVIIIGSVIGGILAIALSFFTEFVLSNSHIIPSFTETFQNIIVSITAISVITCFQAPCIYKWGSERGRIMFFVPIIILSVIVGIFILLMNKMHLLSFFENLKFLLPFMPIILLFVIIIIIYSSYRISYHIFSKKEV